MSSLAVVFLLLAGDLAGAQQALAQGKHADAIDLLGDLADGDDASVDALVVLGRAYLGLREHEAAVDPLLRASDARPDDTALARDAAWACWGAATGPFARAYLEDARRYAVRAGDARLVADLDFAAAEYAAALAGYRGLPDDDATRLHRTQRIALCLRGLEKPEEARAAYGKVLDEALRLDDLDAAYRAAFSGEQVGRFLAHLDARLAKDPDDVRVRLYRGYARAERLLYAEAAEDLRIVAAAKPEHLAVHSRLCLVLARLGAREQRPEAFREAEEIGRAVLERDPAQQEAWEAVRWLTFYAWANRDVPKSYELLKFLHGIDPEDRDVALNFTAMARRLGHYDEAAAAFEALLELYPDDPAVLNDYGILADGRGDAERALALWRRVLEEDPSDLNALENLFTKAWERGDRQAMDRLLPAGLAAARERGDAALEGRWLWFRDRLSWAPHGFGGR